MTQADRDRLVALEMARKKLITRRAAAEELESGVPQVQRLLAALKDEGDKAVVHGLRGQPSSRRIEEAMEREAVRILSAPVYEGFGPALAAEYLSSKHGIEAGRETVRQSMMRGKLRRPRRSRMGELVRRDTSDHDRLEGRGEPLYLIAMIDDATSRLFARFVRRDSTAQNMRPLAFCTGKASLFQTAEKRKRDQPGVEKVPVGMPPAQIGRGERCRLTSVESSRAGLSGPAQAPRQRRKSAAAEDLLLTALQALPD